MQLAHWWPHPPRGDDAPLASLEIGSVMSSPLAGQVRRRLCVRGRGLVPVGRGRPVLGSWLQAAGEFEAEFLQDVGWGVG